MPTVNLDALIPREDFEVLSDGFDTPMKQTADIKDLEHDAFFYGCSCLTTLLDFYHPHCPSPSSKLRNETHKRSERARSDFGGKAGFIGLEHAATLVV